MIGRWFACNFHPPKVRTTDKTTIHHCYILLQENVLCSRPTLGKNIPGLIRLPHDLSFSELLSGFPRFPCNLSSPRSLCRHVFSETIRACSGQLQVQRMIPYKSYIYICFFVGGVHRGRNSKFPSGVFDLSSAPWSRKGTRIGGNDSNKPTGAP